MQCRSSGGRAEGLFCFFPARPRKCARRWTTPSLSWPRARPARRPGGFWLERGSFSLWFNRDTREGLRNHHFKPDCSGTKSSRLESGEFQKRPLLKCGRALEGCGHGPCLSSDLALSFNAERPDKWLVDINPNLNDGHQRVDKTNKIRKHPHSLFSAL